MDYLQPSRVPAAVLAAATSATFVLLVYTATDVMLNPTASASASGGGEAFLLVFMVALFHAIAIGLPAHQLVPARWRYSFRAIAPGSFLVGGVPIPLLLLLVALATSGDGLDGSWVEALAAWLSLIFVLGLIGLVGGIAFWLVVREWEEN